ncbi:MAG: HlyC/CorC family transporter [Bacteroidetes bacterium]|nr:MAG: HlyC/CorC family transporter [Bacteroidota bacterium]
MLVFWILLFLTFSALFSGSEIAFISANKLNIELKKKRGGRRGRVITHFYDKPSRFLGALLIGNNIALVVFTALMTIPLDEFFMARFGWAEDSVSLLLLNTIIITIIVLIFGEFLPKAFFQLYGADLLYLLAIPLRVLQYLLSIPTRMMTQMTNFLLNNVLRTELEEGEEVFTRVDLINFIQDTTAENEEEDIDKELFHKALHLKDKKVRSCMVPRTELSAIDVSETVQDLEQQFVQTKHSRLLVIDEDIDDVLGYVHHQQLLNSPATIREMVLDILFTPEVTPVIDLMNTFIKTHISIACVVDEFGGVSGIITLEDIQEEIFGEIEDEHDVEEHVEVAISEDEYRFSGRLEIDYINEKYELNLPEGDYHTLSGYIVMTTGNIPEEGQTEELGEFSFTFEVVSNTKIEVVKLTRIKEEIKDKNE